MHYYLLLSAEMFYFKKRNVHVYLLCLPFLMLQEKIPFYEKKVIG